MDLSSLNDLDYDWGKEERGVAGAKWEELRTASGAKWEELRTVGGAKWEELRTVGGARWEAEATRYTQVRKTLTFFNMSATVRL